MNNSRFYRDSRVYEKLKHPNKYCGKDKKIITRSSWEKKLILSFFDTNPAVVSWASESIVIPYRSELDGKTHRYFVDFYMKLKNGKEYLIEVKPKDFLTPPNKPKRKTAKSIKGYHLLMEQYIKNTSKWQAARQYCEYLKSKGRNIEFKILTEKEIFYG